MIFVTVGSALPFDRLIGLVDDAVGSGLIQDEVFAQIGESHYEPRNFKFARFLERSEFDAKVRQASLIIGHAGIGTITSALEAGIRLLVLPRSPRHGELVDDHQEKTAMAFAASGHLLVFHTADELRLQLEKLEGFQPTPRCPNVRGISDSIASFLEDQLNLKRAGT